LTRSIASSRVVSEPVTIAELEKVKVKVELGLVQSLETASGKAEQIGFIKRCSAIRCLFSARGYRRTTRSDLESHVIPAKERRTIVEAPEPPAGDG
jgi:hypothetical protein